MTALSESAGGGVRSAPEDLGVVLERLELERVARGIEYEHRRLLAGLPGEAGVRFDHELDAGGKQPIGQLLPLRRAQQQAEMRNGHVVAVDRVVGRSDRRSTRCATIW